MNEAERKVVDKNDVKLFSTAIRIEGSDLVEACIIQGNYEYKAYNYVSSQIAGTPANMEEYFLIERDSFIDDGYKNFLDMYWFLRRLGRLDVIFFSVRYSRVLYIKIVGYLPETVADEEIVISRGYSHLFGLIKKKEVTEKIKVDVADLSIVEIIKELIIQRFYEEKMLDNI